VKAPVVVILAAGHGTRMRSATPKLLHPLCGQPLIEWPVAAALAAGAGRVVVVQSPDGRLAEVLGDRVSYAVQAEARGTADAVRCAAELIDRDAPVIVLAGDVPLITPTTLTGLLTSHERDGAAATMVTAVVEDAAGYGRVVRAPDGTVERVVETKTAGDATELELAIREVNTGIFAFHGGALLEALQDVRPDNAQGEFYLPDVLPALRAREHAVVAYELAEPTEALGINDRVGLAEVRALAQARVLDRLMRSGVTVVAPDATVVDVGVEVGQDSVLEPFSTLRGATRVGGGVTIGSHTTLIDCTVHEGARVIHSHAVQAEIGPRVNVGPFAYLRPGTVLRAGSKVGTFVEVKNSDVGEGSKIPHLSYIGDADIGDGTNLGAATITANYDGMNKHRTTIGDRVKTSVDTTFVAPVTVGDDAYTAAGSVITEDVPAGALGVARARQRNIEGYTERRQKAAETAQPDPDPSAKS
jgi:bifunctional UDP-N-acetylglucosamine pyrophosphorylase / glucosamine-1-phosphate N-acetyltransferase